MLNNANNKCGLALSIRSKLTDRTGMIKIMWVPGHVGITGNEAADQRAKLATNEPLVSSPVMLTPDFKRLIRNSLIETKLQEWQNFYHHYKNYNLRGLGPIFPLKVPCNDLKSFTRLRIGHTIVTHSHIMKGENRPQCPFCTSPDLSVIHLLDECANLQYIRTEVFGNATPSSYLGQMDPKHIQTVAKFLKLANLKHLI